MTTPGGGSVGGGGDLGTVRGKIVIDASEAQKGTDKATSAVQDFENKSKGSNTRMGADAKKFATVYGAVVAGGIGLAVKAASDFEQSLANVAAAGGKDAANQMDQVRAKALQLGADTKFSATEAADAMEVLIKAGLSVDDVLNGAADAAVNLAAAEGIDIPQAAEIAAVAMTAFNLKASDMPAIANKISQAASATKMDVNDFAQAMNQAGAVSKLVGLKFDDMALAITAMGKAGIVGSDAGTSLKTMLMNLQPSTVKASNLMKDLGIITKNGANNFFDATGHIKSMADISEVLYQATRKLSPAQRQQALETIFGSDAIRAAAIIAEKGAAGMNNLTKEMNNQLSVADKAKIKQDTLQGALEKMKGSVETAAIKFGTVFIPVLRDIAGWLEKVADRFANLPKPIQEAIGWTMIVTGALVGLGLLFNTVGKAITGLVAVFDILKLAIMDHPIILIGAIIAGIIIAIIANWDKVSKALIDSWNFLKSVAETVWGAIRDFFVGIWNGIKDAFNSVCEWLGSTWLNTWNEVGKMFSDFGAWFGKIFVDFWNWLMRVFTDFGHWVGRTWDSLLNGVKSTWDALGNFLSSLPGTILNNFWNFGTLLWNAGRDLIVGLWNGIKAALDWLWNGIKSIGEGIVNWFKLRLGISSPSKVTFEMGEFLTIGLGDGVESKLANLKRSLEAAGALIEPTLAPYISAAASGTGSPLAVLDRPLNALGTTTPNGVSAANQATIVIQRLEIPVQTILDPTDPVQWRNAMKAIRDGINQVEKEYGGT